MNRMILLLLCLTGLTLSAQEEVPANRHPGSTDVIGTVYRVLDRMGGPIILWMGEPVAPGQVERESDRLIRVSTPDRSEERLLIYLFPDGTLDRVVDLEYRQRPTAVTGRPEVSPTEPFDWGERVEVTFRNGLTFEYAAGRARATYRGLPVAVSGERGRYLVKTDDFEAGIAFGPDYGETVYRYLTLK